MNEKDLETYDMIQLIKMADMLGWDENRLLYTCHNLICLDESLDKVFVKTHLSVVKN